MGSEEMLATFGRIYPPERLLTQPAQLVPYESDALTAYRSHPLAVVIPESQN
jgi:glycolate oxidase